MVGKIEQINKTKATLITNALLLIWFSLDMFGVKIGNMYLVEGAFKDDGIFMLISIVTFLLFIYSKKLGKIVHLVWLSVWFVAQFLSHEWYTIFGKGFMGIVDGKIAYFQNCIKLINIQGRYVPDLYHTILHILIIVALITTLMDIMKSEYII